MGLTGKGVVVRQVNTQQSSNNSTCCSEVSYDDYDIPYYYPSLNTITWLGSIIFWFLIVGIIVQAAIIGLIAFLAPRRKSYKCPECKRVFPLSGEIPDYCELCGADLKKDMRPH